LGPTDLKLHIQAGASGTLSGTLDSPDQGVIGLPCSDFHVEGEKFSFAVPVVHGTWSGTIENGGALLAGTWSQGTPMSLTFTRDTFVASSNPSVVDGLWLGTLPWDARTLRIQIAVKSDSAGREYCTVDNPDLGFFGLPCTNVVFYGEVFSFELPAAFARWSGKLSKDTHSLRGTWSQRGHVQLPLNLERQSELIPPTPPRPIAYDPAIQPLDAASMQAVLDRDLAGALKHGALSRETSAGVAIGVIRNGVRRVFSYGQAKPGALFQIGSVTKTFTGLALAQLIVQGRVRLDEPVRALLPADTVAKPEGAEVTLLDLITHHSGLPVMPDNPVHPDNPFADYQVANLYHYIRAHGLEKPANATFLYSSLGVGLLGQALANRAGTSYVKLITEEVLKPLGMSDTHLPAYALSSDALAPAGALRSTPEDMLTYLEANLHPGLVTRGVRNSATLPTALELSHQSRADASPGTRIAFAWFYETDTGTYWHGGTADRGSAYIFFNPEHDYAGVVLMNTPLGRGGRFADVLGRHIEARFAGKPAVSLTD